MNINNIEQWEESHDNDNKELRNTLDVMKSNRLTTPFAVAYEKFMDKKELREAAFPFKSLKHTIAATDIFPGIKYKNYKISYENISTQTQMFADEYHRLYNENISKKKLPENVYYLLYKRFLQLNENSK